MLREPRRLCRARLIEMSEDRRVARRHVVLRGPFPLVSRVTREVDLRKADLNDLNDLIESHPEFYPDPAEFVKANYLVSGVGQKPTNSMHDP